MNDVMAAAKITDLFIIDDCANDACAWQTASATDLRHRHRGHKRSGNDLTGA